MIDYDYFYRSRHSSSEPFPGRYDLFVSSWDDSERVRHVHEIVDAERKDWLIHPQYKLSAARIPSPAITLEVAEDTAIPGYLDKLRADGLDLSEIRLCVDITGMIRPHLMFLAKMLRYRGVRRFDALYAEPLSYANREHTRFNGGDVITTKEVVGFQGINTTSEIRDVLVVAPGFDELSLKEVMNDKEHALLVEIFGLPSLQADMYQLNVLKAQPNVPRHTLGLHSRRFASASDPFAVAAELGRIREQLQFQSPKRFYFAPLATKAQALGFALFYMAECEGQAASIIYPYAESYEPGTGSGVSGIWKYEIDFDLMDRLTELAAEAQV